MDISVRVDIENLRRASLAVLRKRHLELFHEEARSRHRDQLFRKIAWRLQAVRDGDLSERARKRAEEIAQDVDLRVIAPPNYFVVEGTPIEIAPTEPQPGDRDPRLPKPGTLLSRVWQGRTILVEVLVKGFRYDGRQFPSLSAVAFEVTGAHWNGWGFFGLISASRTKGKDTGGAER